MDRDRAIAAFIENVDRLACLPFVTDREFKDLYGQEVAEAFEELDRINQEEMICRKCESNCCRKYGCELYAPQFGQCPVHDLRPAICRFHFCEKFRTIGGPTIMELSEIFLYSLSAAAAGGCPGVKFFNPPPFAKVSPGLVEIINPLVNGVQSGKLEPEYVRRRIRSEVMQYYA